MKIISRLIIIFAIFIALKIIFPLDSLLFFYPIMLLVTFFHELGHALFNILSGGTVHAMVIHMDGSGETLTSGGSEGITIMGGFIGSALFGNLLFYTGLKSNQTTKVFAYLLITLFTLASIFWIRSSFSIFWLIVYVIIIWLLTFNLKLLSYSFMFIGILSTVYVLRDYNVGPSSDLKAYEETIGFFSATIWMYIWLVIAIGLCILNGYFIYKTSKIQS